MMESGSCTVLIKIINDKLERDVNNILREQNLTSVQMRVLFLLKCAPQYTLSLKEVERKLHVSQPTAAGVVSRLEQKQYILSKTTDEDRRIKLLELTEEGKEQCATALELAVRAEEQLREALGEEDYTVLGRILSRAMDALGIVCCEEKRSR